jgi:hypothetical protein
VDSPLFVQDGPELLRLLSNRAPARPITSRSSPLSMQSECHRLLISLMCVSRSLLREERRGDAAQE